MRPGSMAYPRYGDSGGEGEECAGEGVGDEGG